MRIVLALCLCGAALLTGCSEKPAIHGAAGKRCVVQYRANYIENGPPISVEGVLLKTSAEWVVVTNDAGEFVIPIYSIQSMQLKAAAK
jgi:hypothetical protein